MHGFHKKALEDRIKTVSGFSNLEPNDIETLTTPNPKPYDSLIENVIGTFTLPMGVATNFRINGKSYLVPMVTEEPSVIAAVSAGAKAAGNIEAKATGCYVRGQIQIVEPQSGAEQKIKSRLNEIETNVEELLSKHMSIHDIQYEALAGFSMSKLEIVINTDNAMGANAVNTVCEGVAPLIEEITGGRVLLRILSNAPSRFGYAKVSFDVEKEVGENILLAYQFALADPNRAVTHNKGIMNGITAVALATGQDTRAIEAAAHIHATENSRYGPLSKWEMRDGKLWGVLSVPLSIGTVGGMTSRHKTAAVALKMLGNPDAGELACIMASVGLCQNFSALRALCTDGIQKGHMKLHARRL